MSRQLTPIVITIDDSDSDCNEIVTEEPIFIGSHAEDIECIEICSEDECLPPHSGGKDPIFYQETDFIDCQLEFEVEPENNSDYQDNSPFKADDLFRSHYCSFESDTAALSAETFKIEEPQNDDETHSIRENNFVPPDFSTEATQNNEIFIKTENPDELKNNLYSEPVGLVTPEENLSSERSAENPLEELDIPEKRIKSEPSGLETNDDNLKNRSCGQEASIGEKTIPEGNLNSKRSAENPLEELDIPEKRIKSEPSGLETNDDNVKNRSCGQEASIGEKTIPERNLNSKRSAENPLEELDIPEKRIKNEPSDLEPSDDNVKNSSCGQEVSIGEKTFKLIPIWEIRNLKSSSIVKQRLSELNRNLVKSSEAAVLTPISDVSDASNNSDIRIKNLNVDESESNLLSERAAQIFSDENSHNKITANEFDSSLKEKFEIIKIELKPHDSEAVVKDVNNNCSRQESSCKKTFKLIPISDISTNVQKFNQAEASQVKQPTEIVYSTNVSAFKSLSNSEPSEESELEDFSVDVLQFFNLWSVIDKNDVEQGAEYMSVYSLNNSLGLFTIASSTGFLPAQDSEQPVVTCAAQPACQESIHAILLTPTDNLSHPACQEDSVNTNVQPLTSSVLLPVVTSAVQLSCQDSVIVSLQSVTSTVSHIASKTDVIHPSDNLQPSESSSTHPPEKMELGELQVSGTAVPSSMASYTSFNNSSKNSCAAVSKIVPQVPDAISSIVPSNQASLTFPIYSSESAVARFSPEVSGAVSSATPSKLTSVTFSNETLGSSLLENLGLEITENAAVRSVEGFATQESETISSIASSNLPCATVFPTVHHHAVKPIPSVPQIPTDDVLGTASIVKPVKSCDVAGNLPFGVNSAVNVAYDSQSEAPDILNSYSASSIASIKPDAIPITTTGRSIPVINESFKPRKNMGLSKNRVPDSYMNLLSTETDPVDPRTVLKKRSNSDKKKKISVEEYKQRLTGRDPRINNASNICNEATYVSSSSENNAFHPPVAHYFGSSNRSDPLFQPAVPLQHSLYTQSMHNDPVLLTVESVGAPYWSQQSQIATLTGNPFYQQVPSSYITYPVFRSQEVTPVLSPVYQQFSFQSAVPPTFANPSNIPMTNEGANFSASNLRVVRDHNSIPISSVNGDPRTLMRVKKLQTVKAYSDNKGKGIEVYAKVGKVYIDNFVELVLHWNADWLRTQDESDDCPPMCESYYNVKLSYIDERHYYNTYIPLHLLSMWCRTYNCWKGREGTLFQCMCVFLAEKRAGGVKITCSTLVNAMAYRYFPKQEDIALCSMKKPDGSTQELFLIIKSVVVKNYNPRLKELELECHSSLPVTAGESISLQVLVNARIAVLQNEAFKAPHPSIKDLLLKPERYSHSIEIARVKPNCHIKILRDDILSIVDLYHSRVCLVDTSPLDIDELTTLITLVAYALWKKWNNKVLMVLRREELFHRLASRLKQYKPVLAVWIPAVHFISPDMMRLTSEHRVRAGETRDSIVDSSGLFLTTFSSYNARELLSESRVTCIVESAHLCTEADTIMPLALNVKKLILMGTPVSCPDIPKVLQRHKYDVSLFMRLWQVKSLF